MNTAYRPSFRFWCYAVWTIALLIQAHFTQLAADESYYWMYSRRPAWGYFDHPPVIALLIHFGYAIFHSELGVRLLAVACNLGTILALEKLIQPKNFNLFFGCVVSVALIHFIGFLALPDAPLLFFAALFFLVFQRFLNEQKWLDALLLGILSALMFLSKYHAVLVVAAAVLSNLWLLRKRQFWLAIVLAAFLLLPHAYWQYSAGFPSIKYHLLERSAAPWQFSFTLEYVLGQLFVLGPVTGLLFFIAAWKVPANTPLARTLKNMFWGLYAFFLLMSFKGRVEAHWLLLNIIPGLFFGYQYAEEYLRESRRQLMLIVSISLIATARLLLMIPDTFTAGTPIAPLLQPFHQKQNMQALARVAGSQPVAFMNSYQQASLYTFYGSGEGFSLNNLMGRKNQFDIWKSEDEFRGKRTLLIPNYSSTEFNTITNGQATFPYIWLNNFQAFSGIRIETDKKQYQLASDSSLKLSLRFWNMNSYNIDSSITGTLSCLAYSWFDGTKMEAAGILQPLQQADLAQPTTIEVPAPPTSGKKALYLSIKTGNLPPGFNSDRLTVICQ
ncbi:MAG: glycosyltransferase family 39 protein [Chitinophagales bacterium]